MNDNFMKNIYDSIKELNERDQLIKIDLLIVDEFCRIEMEKIAESVKCDKMTQRKKNLGTVKLLKFCNTCKSIVSLENIHKIDSIFLMLLQFCEIKVAETMEKLKETKQLDNVNKLYDKYASEDNRDYIITTLLTMRLNTLKQVYQINLN